MICASSPNPRAFDAVNVTLCVPTWALVGVQLNVPDVLVAFAVNVAPKKRGAAVSEAMASPSGSAALTVNGQDVRGRADRRRGRDHRSWSVFAIVIAVEAEPERAFDAVNVTL